MRVTVNMPDELISEVQKLSGEESKTRAITIAMQEFVRQQKIKKLIALRGKVQIDYDWKNEERTEMKTQGKRKKILKR